MRIAMTARVTLLTGPPQSGKTTRLLARYRLALASLPPGAALWLAPTWRAAAEVRRRLLGPDLPACFSPGVMTFEKFADSVLQAAPAPVRPVSRLMKRQLVRQLLADLAGQKQLRHFRPIADKSGLVDLLCELIGELKRLEIWPEHFRAACARRTMTAKDEEVLKVYEGYQQALQEHGLYDAEGRFWSARDWLSKSLGVTVGGDCPSFRGAASENGTVPVGSVGAPRPGCGLRAVVADGFADFTRTQHEILDILAGAADELWISLPLEPPPRRDDLFDKPLRTLAELRRRHAGLHVEELGRQGAASAAPWLAMAHVERRLFGNPRQVESAPDTRGIEIVAAAGVRGELQAIAGRIKRLLASGAARADEIAVVFRSPADAASAAAEVFADYGIPAAFEVGPRLDRCPALRALAALLRLAVEDWPLPQLRAALRSNYFAPDWPEWHGAASVAAIEWALVGLQLPGGRREILDALAQAAAGEDEQNEEHNDASSRRRAGEALAVLRRLAGVLDELPARATLPQWGHAWQRLAAQTGLRRVIAAGSPPGAAMSDAAAWDRLQAAVAAADQLSEWLRQRPPELDPAAAQAALADILGSERLGHGGDESGHVRVLSAASVRAMQFPHLFVAGLAEQSFPQPDREDRLYSEAESQRLIEEGLPLVAHAERSREEMLLFYETLTRATRRLTLSFPAMDERAQPLLPSPYLLEVEAACGETRIARCERTDLSPLPAEGEPLSAAQWRIAALDAALGPQRNTAPLAAMVQAAQDAMHRTTGAVPVFAPGTVPIFAPAKMGLSPYDACDLPAESILAGLLLLDARKDRDGFGPAEGLLPSATAQARAGKRFGRDRDFTATELEAYAACPYRFFIERVLKLQPLEEAELDVDYLERGRLAHEFLARFHQRTNERLGRPGSPRELDALGEAAYQQLFDATFDEVAPPLPGPSLAAALREIDRRVLRKTLDDYRRQIEAYDELWSDLAAPLAPEFFEAAFGPARGAGPRQTDLPLELTAGDETVRVCGRIDRIDTGRAGRQPVFNVIDYKLGGSGGFDMADFEAGTALQLPIYALAVAELLLADRDPVPWQAGYWRLKAGGYKQRAALKMYEPAGDKVALVAEWEACRDQLAAKVAAIVGGMRRGEFPVFSPSRDCTRNCHLKTLCRIQQVRSLEKTWQPTQQPPTRRGR